MTDQPYQPSLIERMVHLQDLRNEYQQAIHSPTNRDVYRQADAYITAMEQELERIGMFVEGTY